MIPILVHKREIKIIKCGVINNKFVGYKGRILSNKVDFEATLTKGS